MQKDLEEIKDKPQSKLQWFLIVILIPSLFAITVALIVLTFAGVNVFEKANDIGAKIPFVSGLMKGEKKESVKEYEKQIAGLEAEMKDREAKIEQLQKKIDNNGKDIERVQLEKQQLEAQIDELTAIQEENKRAFKDIVRTYESMSPKSAAPIIAKMTDEEALKILTNIKADTLAAIMEKMTPEEAAKYTEMLTNETEDQQLP
ncbi:MotE family protein [Bacillus sp. T33-2]|uniref:MotE family protein n=1 Tax=Bacillus sp. T33-2 TaxID=2054168 RepID=UPI000C766C5C|nr:MotE family protein [Bacillus sp. T33-2]PLR97273.1 hypothetical protein CVD19_07235 [Bacillus sp. T33-2]